HLDVPRRLPVSTARLASLFANTHRRRNHPALSLNLRRLPLLPSGRPENRIYLHDSSDRRSRRALARLQRACDRDHGVDWRLAHSCSASNRSKPVSIVLHVSLRARRRGFGSAQTLARAQLNRLLRHTTTLLDLVQRTLPSS